MKSKTVEKATVASHATTKLSGVKKKKGVGRPVGSLKLRAKNSLDSLKPQDLTNLKKKTTKTQKQILKVSKAGALMSGRTNAKSSSVQQKEKEKKCHGKKKKEFSKKEIAKDEMKNKKTSVKAKVKSKQKCETKAKSKKKESRDINQFIELWSLASIGKREASLNATMKVNIMYERQTSPKKSSSADSSPTKSLPSPVKSPSDSKKCVKENIHGNNKVSNSSSKNEGTCSKKENKESGKKTKNATGPVKSTDKKSASSNKKASQCNKRKNQNMIFEDEPEAKVRKKENEKKPKAKSKKTPKKQVKTNVLGHNLGNNIIEKSPRQASLIAKAMIAMEQEDDIPVESAARTEVYDWTEVRSCVVSESRKMTWVTGRGDLNGLAQAKEARDNDATNADVTVGDLVSPDVVQDDSYSLHQTLLKTIHQSGDARLLKEFFRSQKEDFPGDVDIERCPTPEPLSLVKEPPPPPPSPKKKTISHSPSPKKKQEEQIIKPKVPSPSKPKPCRVATPIPQFPSGQRPSHISSFIPHPAAQQSLYPTLSQHQKQPQPIKVTPYAPSSAFVYQYPPDRQQQGIFVPNTPSPMPYGADANDLVQRNYPPTFTFNQMGGLSFERQGLNPYQHPQSNAYNPSMHLPMQPIGFNFQQFYQPSLQQLHRQQNLQSLQPVPLAHQQYPLVPPPSVIQPAHSLNSNLGPIRPYQSTYPQYPPTPSTEMKQDKPCMPPPPCPVPQSIQQESPIIQPLPSYRRALALTPQVQSHKLVKPSPERLSTNSSANLTLAPSSAVNLSFNSQRQSQKMFTKSDTSNIILNPQPIKPPAAINVAFRPILCKKEAEVVQQQSEKVKSPGSVESTKKANGNLTSPEYPSTSMSDILHSAHSTMFSVEEKTSECIAPISKKQTLTVTSSNSSPVKVSQLTTILTPKSNENFNGSYSVSSILEMPNYKVKSEPKMKSCAVNTDQSCSMDQNSKVAKKETYYICIPPKVSGKPGTSLVTTTAIPLKENFAFKMPEKKPLEPNMKQFPHDSKVIIINDSDDSSDDEPLAKLVQPKPNENMTSKVKNSGQEVKKPKTVKTTSKPLKVKLFDKTPKHKISGPKEMKAKLKSRDSKENKKSSKVFTQLNTKQSNDQNLKQRKTDNVSGNVSLLPCKKDKEGSQEHAQKDSGSSSQTNNISNGLTPAKKTGPKLMKKVPVKRKPKCQTVIPPILPKVKATHGWSWIGEGEWKMVPKLTLQKEEPLRLRKCYKSMKHEFGEVISVKDCVILQSDGDGSVPYVGKVSALWENLNGDMMFSMLWYYQPEHTATGREPEDGEQELFASKHREENSVACIDDKCYVLMYNEYCRMEADAVRQELGLPTPCSHQMIPQLLQEDRSFLRPLPPTDICNENIWFCRYDYDIRKKIVRKPKHKKTDLRYRGPCKLVQ